MFGGGEFGYLNIPRRLEFYVVCTKKKYLTFYNLLRINRERIDMCILCKVCENNNKKKFMDCNYTMQVRGRLNI